MPYIEKDVKAKELYDVANRIRPHAWLEFARSETYLNISQTAIEEIECDYRHSVRERKYQMLLIWKEKLGTQATVEFLNELCDRFLGRISPQSQCSVPPQTGTNSNQATPNENVTSSAGNGSMGAATDHLIPLDTSHTLSASSGHFAPTSETYRNNNQNTETDGSNSITISGSSMVDSNVHFSRGNLSIIHNWPNTKAFRSDTPTKQSDQACASEPTDQPPIASSNDLAITGDICTFFGNDIDVTLATKDSFEQHTSLYNIYGVTNIPKGYALLINNINFPSWGKDYKRTGSKEDCELMNKLFGNEGLGLQTQVEEDKTKEDMMDIIKQFAKDPCHKKANMCVVIIMSHGTHISGEGSAIYGTDCEYNLVDKVVKLFDNKNCPNLRGKPKMFFFQFCRGGTADHGIFDSIDDIEKTEEGSSNTAAPGSSSSIKEILDELLPEGVSNGPKEDVTDGPKEDVTDGKAHLPTRSDMLIVFATQKRNLSFRSWLTNAIANVFSKKAHSDHVCDMLTDVNNGVSQRVSSNKKKPKIHQRKQMCEWRSTLLKRIYFFPGFPKT